jgi:hypothetical protein
MTRERWKFHAYQGIKSGSLVVSHKGLTFRFGSKWLQILFPHLLEMRKVHAAKKIKVGALKPHLEAIEFRYRDEAGLEQCEVISMAEDLRHEIFSLVLGVSGLGWRALQIDRHNKAGDENESQLDHAFKS